MNILSKITPTKEERTTYNDLTKEVCKLLNQNLEDAKAILGGSGAKDTWLSHSHDADIFVMFNYSKFKDQSNNLSDLLEPTIKKIFKKYHRVHGSRDYFQFTYKNLSIEVIPILKIKDATQAINITDVSPLHADWVNQYELKDEIRLAKQFFRAQRIYGAESYLGGFSGYITEILTIHYGSFNNLLNAATKWKIPTIIDTANHYKGQDVLFEMNSSKLTSPLIIVDPVDKTRNAAAALTKDKFKKLIKAAKAYLKNPDETFFEKELFTKETLKGKHHLVYIKLVPLKGKKDVVGGKVKKCFDYLSKELEQFGLKRADWELNEDATLFFICKIKELPLTTLRKGPPLKLKEAVKKFKQIHKNAKTVNDHLVAEIKTPHTNLNLFIQHKLKQIYVKEKIDKIISVDVF